MASWALLISACGEASLAAKKVDKLKKKKPKVLMRRENKKSCNIHIQIKHTLGIR